MSLKQRFAKWLLRNAWDSSQITRGSQAWNDLFGVTSGLPALSETTALTVSAINACVFLLSGVIAALPVNLYKVDAKGFRDEIWGDSLWWVLNEEMSARWSAANGWEFLAASLLLHGNAYCGVLRDGFGRVVGLDPWHPNRVEVLLDAARNRLVYSVEPDPNAALNAQARQKRQVFDQDDVIHVAGMGWDGIKGLSPLRHALRMAGAVSFATQEFSANFFANSARPDYALTSQGELSEESLTKLRARLLERHQGVGNSFLPMILHGGMDIKTLSIPLEDLQLVAMRQFQVEEIARIFGVPPFMIGHNEKTTSWGSGIEAMGIGFTRYTMRPYLNKIENELNRKLIRNGPKLLAFDTEELERADLKSLYESLRSGVGRAGERQLVSINEARKKLRLKPTEGGDEIETEAQPMAATPEGNYDDAQSQAAQPA